MNQAFFSIRLRRYTTLGFFFVMAYFAFLMGASAQDRCPTADDHEVSAIRYQMFTAYQVAFDGYQAPCELKCFENVDCLSSCQEKKALESLTQHFHKELKQRGLKSCATLSEVCLEQCSESSKSCQQACKG